MDTPARRAIPAPSDLTRHWMLDPEMVFLNHGSFGACPREVLQEQSRLREEMEREPVRFFVETLPQLIDRAREELASFVHCRGEDLVFVPNATTGVATVLAHLREHYIASDHEIIATSHEYPACINNLNFVANLVDFRVVRAEIPFPIQSEDEVVDAVLRTVTSRTRAALISHITAPTGLVLPMARLVHELEGRGITVIVDGAHAPGMVDLNLDKLGASFYTANCHKWLCAPKGTAFLHIREDRQTEHGGFRPLVLSNMAEKPQPGRKHLLTEFDYTGTQDFTPWACIPAVLRFAGKLVDGGWPAVQQRNHEMVVQARRLICRKLGVESAAPESMLGSMATIILPAHDAARTERLRARPTKYHDALQDALIERYRIQIPIWGLPDRPERFVRPSAQLYNAPEQYEYLANALAEEFEREQTL